MTEIKVEVDGEVIATINVKPDAPMFEIRAEALVAAGDQMNPCDASESGRAHSQKCRCGWPVEGKLGLHGPKSVTVEGETVRIVSSRDE